MIKSYKKCVAIFALFQIFYIYCLLLTEHNPTTTNCISKEPAQTVQYSIRLIKFIHQSWKTNTLPPSFELWSKSWKKCYPDWQYKLWTDEDNRKLILQTYPWFLSTYDSFPGDIHRADMMRAFYMHKYGGIYTDLDTECLKKFDHMLENATIVFGAMAGQPTNLEEGYIQNSFMYSVRGHSFWISFIHDVMDTVNQMKNHSNNYVNWPGNYTGPGAIANSIKKYRKVNENDFTVYPPIYFNPYSWKEETKHPKCKTLNQMQAEEYLKCRSYFVNSSYVVEYHTMSWSDGEANIKTALANVAHEQI